MSSRGRDASVCGRRGSGREGRARGAPRGGGRNTGPDMTGARRRSCRGGGAGSRSAGRDRPRVGGKDEGKGTAPERRGVHVCRRHRTTAAAGPAAPRSRSRRCAVHNAREPGSVPRPPRSRSRPAHARARRCASRGVRASPGTRPGPCRRGPGRVPLRGPFGRPVTAARSAPAVSAGPRRIQCADRKGSPGGSRRPVRCIARRSVSRVRDVLGCATTRRGAVPGVASR